MNYTCQDIRRTFEGGTQGERVVALGLLQALAYEDCLDVALKGIGESQSPFEQYHALRAAQGMLGSLSREQRGELKAVIDDQRSDGDRKWIKPENAARWSLSERILNEIASDGAG